MGLCQLSVVLRILVTTVGVGAAALAAGAATSVKRQGEPKGPRARNAYEPELPRLTSRGKLAIGSVSASAPRVGRFEKLELTVDLSATFDDPFDPHEIDVRARFTSPGRESVEVHGFFYQPYRNLNDNDDGTPLLEPAGEPCWKIRFAPTEVGSHTFRVSARDRSGRVEAPQGRFLAVPSKRRGFVGVSKRNGRSFTFRDGTPVFAVGQNLQNDWPRYAHSRLLAESGCNAARVWTFCHWTWLEWTFKPGIRWAGPGHWMRSYAGAGKYNQRIAWIADHHLDRWTRDGIFVMLCLGNSGELTRPDRYDSWGGHPYNVANGGFLKEGKEFWTDERARKLYRQRLRYLVARYGYSTNVWAWELWNELGRETDETVAWHAEMAKYLSEIDPNRHLVTTSFWGTNAEANARTWAIPQIGFTQTHVYAGAPTIRRRVRRMLRLSPKPHIVGEGGGPHPGKDGSIDPEGIELHNSLWAAAMSGAAGTTLPWWWRQRIEPRDLFSHYTAIARFAKAVPWATEDWRPIKPKLVGAPADPARRVFSPVVVVPLAEGWGRRAARNRFTVEPDGSMPHVEELGTVLFGKGRAQWANPPTIKVAYPVAGRFVVHVGRVSHAVLEIELDGEKALRVDALNVPQTDVRKSFGIDVPAGRHEITLRNVGGDWLRIGHILLTDYRDTARYPDIEVYGLHSERTAVLWFHHRLNQWVYRGIGVEPQPIAGGKATVHGLADGDYRVEWWDTHNGAVARTEQKACRDGSLELDLPAIRTDVACAIRPAR